MKGVEIVIAGMGMVTPAGIGIEPLRKLIARGESAIALPGLFPISSENRLLAGQIFDLPEDEKIPRTHQLAHLAATQALADANAGADTVPDAVIMGVTTGGILTTEENLKRGILNPAAYEFHGAGTVADFVARKVGCKGPAITISNACGSGAAAIKLALEMIRSGTARRVLAGGADSLCRLTYYGFKSLQLIDKSGAHPFDKNRRGMSVGEGACVLYLTVNEKDGPRNGRVRILGGGLSCDAYHPSTPDPSGEGALNAMKAALRDAETLPADIDYVNLHGTGTIDNDLSEAKALKCLFTDRMPPLSSIKGALGHSLAAAGAIEAAVCAMSVSDGLICANTGFNEIDPELNLAPITTPTRKKVRIALSNSFGFGGANTALVIGKPDAKKPDGIKSMRPFSISGCSLLCGAGHLRETLEKISIGGDCRGTPATGKISESLDAARVRRLKRLSRMALALALGAAENTGESGGDGISKSVSSVFWGTGWGPLSETHDFLKKLFDTDEKFPSPTDFIGSVHNAPAGQAAIALGAKGPNITTTGGDYSFEQALLSAQILAGELSGPCLVMAADEYHPVFSPLFEPGSGSESIRSDGGGALLLENNDTGAGPKIFLSFYESGFDQDDPIGSLVAALGGARRIKSRFGAVMAGLPHTFRKESENQLNRFMELTGFEGPVIDYRKTLGEFASVSAAAVSLASVFKGNQNIPASLCREKQCELSESGVLVLGFGKYVTAIEIT